MEQNQPMLAKKVWSMVRVAYFMLRKGISKRKLLLDLNMMVKRGKVAGNKALHNLKSHHHHKGPSSLHDDQYSNVDQRDDDDDYENEFSCTNSPSSTTIKKHEEEEEDVDIRDVNAAMLKAMKMIQSETPSGFGKTMVRQLRVTDSPFPSSSNQPEDSHVVDEAAEKFINRFYNNLRRQNSNN
uniref:uncharacterized protein LOC122589762 n=1 Tax=Erigeron canadensis TaxID=72917 RepID=UPI001CB96A2C|nr:uncharacterized protein LOC122589762 [Erigeron canadensis]